MRKSSRTSVNEWTVAARWQTPAHFPTRTPTVPPHLGTNCSLKPTMSNPRCCLTPMWGRCMAALQSRWPPVEPVQSDRWPHSQLHALDLKERVIAFIGLTRPARTNPDGSACWKRVQVRKQTQTQRLSASRAWKRSLRTLKSVLCSFWTCF